MVCSDGVTFEVFVDDGGGEQQVLTRRLDIPAAREGWHEEQVDLGSYAGRTVTLTLSVIPGPEWEMTGDWAGWGEPRIVDTAVLPLVALRLRSGQALRPAEQMVREWRAAGGLALPPTKRLRKPSKRCSCFWAGKVISTATPRSDADVAVEVTCGTDAARRERVTEAARSAFLEAPVLIEMFVLDSERMQEGWGGAGAVAHEGVRLA